MKQQVKVKALYISETIHKFINVSTETVEDVKISTFGNSQTLSKSIDRVLLVAKTSSHENILIISFVSPYVIESKYRISKRVVWKFSWIRVCKRGKWKGNRLVDRFWFVLEFCYWKIVKSGESEGLVAV